MKKAIGIGLVLLMFLTYVIYKVEFKGSYYSNKSIAKEIEEDSKYFDKSTQDIIKKLNNNRYMDQLISKEFKRKDLLNFNYKDSTIQDINNKFQIECLRKIPGYYYSIFKMEDRSYAYVMFKVDKDKKTLVVTDFERMHNLMKKKDFDKIKIGKTTYEEVKKIYPELDKDSVTTNYVKESYITLINGGNITINYNLMGENVVSKNEYSPPHPDCIVNLMLKKDLPQDPFKVWKIVSGSSIVSIVLILVFVVGMKKDKIKL